MGKLIITSASDDSYLHLLLEMVESLGAENLQKHSLGIYDLGLSEASKDKIRQLKSDVIIRKPEWYIEVPDEFKNTFNLATSSRLFMREHFPGYDIYMHLDADLWLLDSTAVDDFLQAAESTGLAVVQNGHPLDPVGIRIRYKKIFGKIFTYGVKTDIYRLMKLYFGVDDPKYFSTIHTVSGGTLCMKADSPIWEKWQEAMQSINYKRITSKRRMSDCTSLLYALVMNDFSYTPMFEHYDWMIGDDEKRMPLFDVNKKILVDRVYPHHAIKVIHIGGGNVNREFSVKTTDGGIIKTKFTRNEFLKMLRKFNKQ